MSIKYLKLFNTKMLKLSKDIFLFTPKMIQVIISQRELVFQLLSNRLNTRPYNRLNKEVTDFKEYKSGLIMLHTTQCFHHQDGEDADNDKRCKMHT